MNAPQTVPTVLVGVDGSEQSLTAVRWAAAEAAARGLPLRLVHAFAWGDEPDLRLLTGGERYRATLLDRARHWLDAAAGLAGAACPGLVVQQHLQLGYPAEVLATEAAGAALLVLGDHGRGRVEELLLGSTATAMAGHSGCPVVVVRGTEVDPRDRAERPVAVGVDDSPSSEAAIGFAFEAAQLRRVPLVASHAYSDLYADPALAEVVDAAALAEFESDRLAERLAGWVAKYPDVAVHRKASQGGAVRRLLELSQHAQLVVVGSRGRGGLAGLLLGSVGNSLLHRAECPVAVVAPEPATGAGR